MDFNGLAPPTPVLWPWRPQMCQSGLERTGRTQDPPGRGISGWDREKSPQSKRNAERSEGRAAPSSEHPAPDELLG